jgi:hypothetical protein
MEEKLNQARQLMREGRYAEARKIISRLKHPNQAAWLANVDVAEARARDKSKGVLPFSAQSLEVPPPPKPSSTNLGLKVPLPLLPEEQRRLNRQTGAQPTDPAKIMDGSWDYNRRNRGLMNLQILIFLFGLKTPLLSRNYFRLKKPLTGTLLELFHIALVIAWFPASLVALVVVSYLTGGIPTDVLALLPAMAVLITLPALPYVVAGAQQQPYRQWQRDYSEAHQKVLGGEL